jgi:glyoxylase-like metal-dependent hydrolase (beta-lactamase superfamily II)
MALIMDQAADGVWLVTGTDNNWVLVADGDEVTLVDAGFPRDLPRVLSSLERIGRAPDDVAAIVLTHAHPDHIGASERLRADRGVPVRLLDAEVPHARGRSSSRLRRCRFCGQRGGRGYWRGRCGSRARVRHGPNGSPRSTRSWPDRARWTCRGG